MEILPRRRLSGLGGLIGLLLLPAALHAQAGSANRSAEIKRALQQAQFQAAADLADSAITHFQDFPPAQLAEIYALRALIFFEQGNVRRAEEHLTMALQLNPHLQLDPVFFSPQLQKRLEELRPEIATPSPSAAPAVRYIVVPDPRLAAAWRSLVLPGWGQNFKGQKTKGRVFSISAASLAGATITAHLLRQRAEKNYLKATAENEINSRYDTFNRYHLLRNNLALTLGVIWGAAVLDALIVRVEPKSAGVGFVPLWQARPMAAGVAVKLVF